MLFGVALLLFLNIEKLYSQQSPCLGYSNSTGICYDCNYTHFRSPNMTFDRLVYPTNCTIRKNLTRKLDIFVTTRNCTSAALCNGTELYPFDEINKAFWAAHVIANENNFTEINFYFLGSPHYVLRRNLPQVNFGYFRRTNSSISMQPCYCSFRNIKLK